MLGRFTALDLTGLEGQLAGKLLAELGMRVIKLEPPDGDAVRRLGPFKDGRPGLERSLRFAFLNGGKESLLGGEADVLALAPAIDVVLESGPPGVLDVAALRRANPRLVVVSITPFGQDGPHAGYLGADIVALAMGGIMSIAGEPGLPPVRAPETQGYYYASACAALGALLALARAERSGSGDHVDVSTQETLASQEHLIREASLEGIVQHRSGSQHKHVTPGRIYPCRDGHVFLFVSSVHWRRFLALWAGHPPAFDAEEWASAPYRRARTALIDPHVIAFTRRYGKLELSDHLQAEGIPCLPVLAPAEFIADPQVAARGLVGEAEHRELGRYRCLRSPFLLDGRRPELVPPPLLGSHGPLPPRREPAPPGRGADARPLEGIRVVSLTTGIAGPTAARLLAQAGAEVIKVESRAGGLDAFRFFGDDLDASPRFLEANLNVRSLTLNLKRPAGLELLKELLARSDVLLENFRPEVLPRLGLDEETLRAVRPDLIVARMPGLGTTGPRSGYGSWGPTLAAFAGLTALWNHPGAGEPVGSQGVYPDYLTAVLAPLAVTAALLARDEYGRGATIEVAQVEAAAYVVGTTYLDTAVNGAAPVPLGNGCPGLSLHGCYPCAGADSWCVVVCREEGEWRRLCALSGIDPAVEDRDAAFAAWTSSCEAARVMAQLQEAGIASGVVQSGAELAADPHLDARGFIEEVEHPSLGRVRLAGFPVRFAETPLEPFRCAPALGSANEEVICGLLGRSRAELARLEETEVVY